MCECIYVCVCFCVYLCVYVFVCQHFLSLLRLAAESSLVALRATHDDDAHNPLPHLLFSVYRGELAASKLSSYGLCVRCVLANVSGRIVGTKDIKVVIWHYYQIRRMRVTN